uniref:G_PROTEIN_RECEP_F1_2 domain-containing protein n=1 Tax=Caenorhabditis tropicalis TaxID=1561998 RepID=A0A1I7UG18_9PELO
MMIFLTYTPVIQQYDSVVVAAACTLPADSLFAVMLYLIYPDSFLPSTLFIVNFSLVLLALLGINSKVSSMILPALVWKCVLLLFLLFLGCISVDAYQVPATELDEAHLSQPQEPTPPHRSIMVWKDLAAKYPMLPFIAVACTIVLAIEARVFFSAWQKICCPAVVNDDSNLEKSPPSYNACVRATASEKDLPSYEDALRTCSNSSSPSSQQPSTSNTSPSNQQRPPHSVYTIPDVKVHKSPSTQNTRLPPSTSKMTVISL